MNIRARILIRERSLLANSRTRFVGAKHKQKNNNNVKRHLSKSASLKRGGQINNTIFYLLIKKMYYCGALIISLVIKVGFILVPLTIRLENQVDLPNFLGFP